MGNNRYWLCNLDRRRVDIQLTSLTSIAQPKEGWTSLRSAAAKGVILNENFHEISFIIIFSSIL
jgi:hypothetical protein